MDRRLWELAALFCLLVIPHLLMTYSFSRVVSSEWYLNLTDPRPEDIRVGPFPTRDPLGNLISQTTYNLAADAQVAWENRRHSRINLPNGGWVEYSGVLRSWTSYGPLYQPRNDP